MIQREGLDFRRGLRTSAQIVAVSRSVAVHAAAVHGKFAVGLLRRRRFDQERAGSRTRRRLGPDAEFAASVAAAFRLAGARRVAVAEIRANAVRFLDDRRTDARFDSLSTGGACRRTRLLHAGVIFDDAILRIRAFVVEARVEAAANGTSVDVLLQAVRTMDVALGDDGTRTRFADADALFVRFEPVGVALASAVDEGITVSMKRIEIPENVGLRTGAVVDGRLAFVFVKLLRRFVGVAGSLTVFHGGKVVFVPVTTAVEEGATTLGGHVEKESPSDVLAGTASFRLLANDFGRKGRSIVDERGGEGRRRRRRLLFRISTSDGASRLALLQVEETIAVAVATSVVKPFARLRILIEIPSDDVIAARTALPPLPTNVDQGLRGAGELTSGFRLEIVLV